MIATIGSPRTRLTTSVNATATAPVRLTTNDWMHRSRHEKRDIASRPARKATNNDAA